MSFPKARNKRFNEVLSCAPPPGYYNPKMNSSKRPGVYIEKTERFKPLVKDSPSKSVSSNCSTSKTCNEQQDVPVHEHQDAARKRLCDLNSRVEELQKLVAEREQQLFETRATLALLTEKRDSFVDLPEHNRIKQIKRSADDSDSEATISADEVTDESNFEVEFLRSNLNKSETNCAHEKKENVNLTMKLNDTQELLKQEKRKSKKMQAKLRKTDAWSNNRKVGAVKNKKCEVLDLPSKSNNVMQLQAQPSLQHKLTSLDSEVLLLNRCIKWAVSLKGKNWCGIGTKIPSFPSSQEFKNLTCCMDLYGELTDIKNGICCKLEDHLKNESQIMDVYSNVIELYGREVELLWQYKKIADEYIAQMRVCIKNNLSELLAFFERTSCEQVDVFNRTKEKALISTCDNIEALNELLKSRQEIDALVNAVETERKSNLTILQGNTELLNENKRLKDTLSELEGEIHATNSHMSEMNGTLTRNNEQINEQNSEIERQSLEISTLQQKISTLEINMQQLSTEKEAVLQCHSKCSLLSDEIEALKASYSVEYNRNADLSGELTASNTKINEMEEEIVSLHRCIDQLKQNNQNRHSELELQCDSLKKSLVAEELDNAEFVKGANEKLQQLEQKYDEESKELLRNRNEMLGELNKLLEENRSQEQLYKEQIILLETKCTDVSQQMSEQVKQYEAEKEKNKNEMLGELNKLLEENRSQEHFYKEHITLLEAKCADVTQQVSEQVKQYDAEKENWKTLYLNLEAKISPFKEQLDAYEAEKSLLLNQNNEKQHELEHLSGKYASLLGHQNHKQKIKHVQKIKDENIDLKKEIMLLQEQNCKQANIIRKLKQGEPRLDLRDPKCEDVLKENRSNTLRQ